MFLLEKSLQNTPGLDGILIWGIIKKKGITHGS